MNKSIHLYYSGTVQGVGFRSIAEREAFSLGLTGWVRNLRDGRVEVVCEGSEPDLKEFIKKMDDLFGQYIMGVDVEWSDASGEFAGFDIR